MRTRLSATLACALALVASPALADKVALLAPSGGNSPQDDAKLLLDLSNGLGSLGHTLVADSEVKAAIAADPALGARTPEGLRALGLKLGADWVVYATDAPAVATERVEIGASFVSKNRFELVGREVHLDKSGPETREMLAVLLRPEGVGTGALPWETAPVAPPPPAKHDEPPTVKVEPPPKPPEPERPHEPYGGGHAGFVAAGLGADGLVKRPAGARGAAASLVGVVRGGVAIAGTGLEPYVQLGGHMAGASAFWAEGGLRYMVIPILHDKDGPGLFVGPSVHGGVYVVPGSSATGPDGKKYTSGGVTTGTLAGAIDVALRLAGRVQLDAQLGEVRWAPLPNQGSTVSVGANLTGGVRF
jgi:hypothetical protein